MSLLLMFLGGLVGAAVSGAMWVKELDARDAVWTKELDARDAAWRDRVDELDVARARDLADVKTIVATLAHAIERAARYSKTGVWDDVDHERKQA